MRFHPHQATNAIALAAFACEFAPPLGETVLQRIGGLYDRFKNQLPQKLERPALAFRIAPGATLPQAQQTVGAIAFSEFDRDGSLLRQFNATPAVITYNELKYSKWVNVWGTAQALLEAALEAAGDAPVQAFGLEYQDRFRAEGGQDEPIDVSSVLSQESTYLPRHVFELRDVWHAFHGFVRQMDQPYAFSWNDNVNVGLVRRPDLPSPNLAVEITLQHRHVLKEPKAAKEARAFMERAFAEMHDHDKDVMENLLTPQMAERIKLRG